jgi:rSAM/selenodomain-associated transferase 2
MTTQKENSSTNLIRPACAHRAGPEILVVIPVLNEVRTLEICLASLQGVGVRIVVVDAQSTDGSLERARELGAQVLIAQRGRAEQMNQGALTLACEQILVFVHADTRLPSDWRTQIVGAIRHGRQWGRFDVQLDSDRPSLALVARMMNLRSRLTGICTGDQAIFVAAETWRRCGGFAQIPLMEDIDLSRRLKRLVGAPAALQGPVLTSARRWETRGVLRTILLMWMLRAMYALGVSPQRLHRLYYGTHV